MRNLITDIAGLRVGHAHDAALKSGVTVLTADAPFTCGVHVMGGAPGTRETDLLAPDKTVQTVDALVLIWRQRLWARRRLRRDRRSAPRRSRLCRRRCHRSHRARRDPV